METFVSWLGGFGISKGGIVVVIFIAMWATLATLVPGIFGITFSWFLLSVPLWLPFVLMFFLWNSWMAYIQALYISKQEHILLEVRIPREIAKSPRAMELFFTGINIGPGEALFTQRWWLGQVRPWWSFELVSINGEIHFYIWTRKDLKDLIEMQMYAQYPEVEIFQVEDYAARFPYDKNVYGVWGCEFKLSAPDVYPIKTYIDYELDKDPKEEFKIDPIAHVFELLSAIKQGEQMWIQIIIRLNKDLGSRKEGRWFEYESRWKEEGKKEIEKIREKARMKYKDKEGKEVEGLPMPTSGQVDQIKAIERSLGKPAFDTGIRGIYIAEEGKFRVINITGLVGVFKQFGSAHLNGFGFVNRGLISISGYPWEDFRNIRQNKMKRELMDAYRRRGWFHEPHKIPHFVMTTEELATIWRFPSSSIKSPGLRRAPAAKAEAPPNLPV